MADLILKIDIKKISDRWDPFSSKVWVTLKKPVTRQEIKRAIENNYLIHPGTPKKMDLLWDVSSRKSHIGRIAWFVVNYDRVQPVEINFGIPQWGCNFDFINGNHRYAAAIYRDEPYIMAGCSGAEDEINEYVFDETEEIPCEAESCMIQP